MRLDGAWCRSRGWPSPRPGWRRSRRDRERTSRWRSRATPSTPRWRRDGVDVVAGRDRRPAGRRGRSPRPARSSTDEPAAGRPQPGARARRRRRGAALARTRRRGAVARTCRRCDPRSWPTRCAPAATRARAFVADAEGTGTTAAHRSARGSVGPAVRRTGVRARARGERRGRADCRRAGRRCGATSTPRSTSHAAVGLGVGAVRPVGRPRPALASRSVQATVRTLRPAEPRRAGPPRRRGRDRLRRGGVRRGPGCGCSGLGQRVRIGRRRPGGVVPPDPRRHSPRGEPVPHDA